MGGACRTDGRGREVYRILWENLKEREDWGDPSIYGRIILRWIFRKWDLYGLDLGGS
jgi:hypothetical protein